MRVLVVSDIHNNLPALEAVLRDAGSFGVLWSRDVVAMAPSPTSASPGSRVWSTGRSPATMTGGRWASSIWRTLTSTPGAPTCGRVRC